MESSLYMKWPFWIWNDRCTKWLVYETKQSKHAKLFIQLLVIIFYLLYNCCGYMV